MSDLSYFESKTGKLICTAEEVYNFVTDIRNFERFIPEGKINDWHADKNSGSFSVPMLGSVSLRLAEKEIGKKVVFVGDALKKDDFTLVLEILKSINNTAEVKVAIKADLNPMLKMMAAKPISQFLEKLITEMEGFEDWKNIKV